MDALKLRRLSRWNVCQTTQICVVLALLLRLSRWKRVQTTQTCVVWRYRIYAVRVARMESASDS